MPSEALQRAHVGDRYSEYVVHNGVIYLAGQVASSNPSADIRGQTREVLGHIDRLLAEAGTDKNRILSCQIFLKDVDQIAAMNEVWVEWVEPGKTPPRATVEARLANPQHLIEIVVTAALR